MSTNSDCTGMRRRDFLRIGGLGVAGLTLPDLLRAESLPHSGRRHADSAIVVMLEGGPSHLETFDPKPDAPAEVRGEFGSIGTGLPGVRLCEHLPKLAASIESYALVRGVSHTLSDHDLGRRYLLTGTKPLASNAHPDYASVLSRVRASRPEVPSSVAIPRSSVGPGFMGPAYSALETESYPSAGRPFSIPSLSLTADLHLDRLERRDEALRILDRRLGNEDHPALLGYDRFSRQAYKMLKNGRVQTALDLRRENPKFAKAFDNNPFSQSCLIAIRLVEAGVRCVTISMGGWDTHSRLFPTLKDRLLPRLDNGLAGLFGGLRSRGLLPSTAVLITGEFGRTPKLNDQSPRPGREHYARCMSLIMAGGRTPGGCVVGSSDAKASAPVDRSIHPEDIAATFYANLGVDPETTFTTPEGRPVTLVAGGKPVSELLAG